MIERDVYKPCIIYPEDARKSYWDMLMSMVLILTCFLTPIHICFNDDSVGTTVLNYCIDFLFLIDMIFTFMSAYHTDDFELIDDHKTIAISYLSGWFLIDLLAIIPF